MSAKTRHEAYCLQCCGGGKSLLIGTLAQAERAATSHQNVYGHCVTILPQAKPCPDVGTITEED